MEPPQGLWTERGRVDTERNRRLWQRDQRAAKGCQGPTKIPQAGQCLKGGKRQALAGEVSKTTCCGDLTKPRKRSKGWVLASPGDVPGQREPGSTSKRGSPGIRSSTQLTPGQPFSTWGSCHHDIVSLPRTSTSYRGRTYRPAGSNVQVSHASD